MIEIEEEVWEKIARYILAPRRAEQLAMVLLRLVELGEGSFECDCRPHRNLHDDPDTFVHVEWCALRIKEQAEWWHGWLKEQFDDWLDPKPGEGE